MEAKVIQVIESRHCRGLGTNEDVFRTVTAYHSLDGELLAEIDPFGIVAYESIQAQRDKLLKELGVLKTENEVLRSQLNVDGTKRNPALEDVLAKLRKLKLRYDMDECSLFYNGHCTDITTSDLRRWVESEKAT